jgi:hypothetical protein
MSEGNQTVCIGRQKSLKLEVPELLTVREVSVLLKVSPDSVTRKFQDLPGVIDLENKGTRFKRAYKALRIPRPVLEKFLHANRGRNVPLAFGQMTKDCVFCSVAPGGDISP